MRRGVRELAQHRATWVFLENQLYYPVPSTARRNQQSPRLLASARGAGRRPRSPPEGAHSPRWCAHHQGGGDGSPQNQLRGCARRLPGGSGCGTGLLASVPLLCSQRRLEAPATLCAPLPDARPQPVEGGARGGARRGAGRGREARAGRGEGCGQTQAFPPLYLSPTTPPPPDPQDWRRGCVRALRGQRTPTVTSQSHLSPVVASCQRPSRLGLPSSTKKSGGVLPLKRGPRSVAARTVRENNGTPPAPGTLAHTLVSPPLPVLPNPPSRAGLRSGRKGTCWGERRVT